MHLAAARNLTLLATILVGSPALACSFRYCAQRLAPADQQSLPANARAFITHGKASERFNPDDGGTIFLSPFIRRLNPDGGVQSLEAAPDELQPTGDYGNATLFLPGPLSPGEQFTIESSRDCNGLTSEPRAEVLIVEPAPFPETFGVPFSPPSIRIDPDPNEYCTPLPSEPYATRELFMDIDESVRPWLNVARVNLEVNGTARSTDYGRMARDFDGGSRVFVDRLTRICNHEWAGEPRDSLQTWLIKLELELPGVQQRPPPVELTVDMDCRQSCASAGVTPWLLGALLLATRRFTSGRRRRNI